MQAYIIRRVAGALFVIFLVGTFIFFMMRVLPGDPASAALGLDAGSASAESIAARTAELGLDKPVIELNHGVLLRGGADAPPPSNEA